jgi:hypothetical protein
MCYRQFNAKLDADIIQDFRQTPYYVPEIQVVYGRCYADRVDILFVIGSAERLTLW